MEIQFRTFLITALDGSEWIASCHGCFTARERAPGTHCIGVWVGPRGGLDAVEKIVPAWNQTLIPQFNSLQSCLYFN
jgi:hypothetical protein